MDAPTFPPLPLKLNFLTDRWIDKGKSKCCPRPRPLPLLEGGHKNLGNVKKFLFDSRYE